MILYKDFNHVKGARQWQWGQLRTGKAIRYRSAQLGCPRAFYKLFTIILNIHQDPKVQAKFNNSSIFQIIIEAQDHLSKFIY